MNKKTIAIVLLAFGAGVALDDKGMLPPSLDTLPVVKSIGGFGIACVAAGGVLFFMARRG